MMSGSAVPAAAKLKNASVATQSKSVLHDWYNTRAPYRQVFLEKCGWADADVTFLREDMGPRRYMRLSRPNGDTRVLMESVPDGHEYAISDQRLDDYVMIAQMLRDHGVYAPCVDAYDYETGYVLVEDFGDMSFRKALTEGLVSRDDIYSASMDVLVKLSSFRWPADVPRKTYYEGIVHKARSRLMHWYVPMKRGKPNDPGMVESFLARWQMIEDEAVRAVGAPIQGFVHGDFHLENLQWRAGQTGLDRAGLLDFQDGRPGPAVYDLTNLLNDARISLDPDYKRKLLNEFLSKIPAQDRANYERWFWIYSGHFLHRVAGQFVKHAVIGNTRYLQFMPFIQANLKDIFSHDFLAPVGDYLDSLGVDLEPFPDGFDFSARADLISADAF